MRLAKTQISLGIHPVWSVRMKKAWVLSYPLSAQRRLWSDWADAQTDASLRWAHSHFVGFVMSRLNWYAFLFVHSSIVSQRVTMRKHTRTNKTKQKEFKPILFRNIRKLNQQKYFGRVPWHRNYTFWMEQGTRLWRSVLVHSVNTLMQNMDPCTVLKQ